MKILHLNSELINKIDRTEVSYTQGRMSVIPATLGDPNAVRFIEKANLRAVMAPEVPNSFFNRILISGPLHNEDLLETLAQFQTTNVSPFIEISPGGIDESSSAAMISRGFSQTGFKPVFVTYSDSITANKPDLEIRAVSNESELEAFKDVYVRGWDTPPFLVPMMHQHIAKWIDFPGWTLYLAYEGDSPIACAILYCFEDMAYLADATTPLTHRGKGGHSALLHARVLSAQKTHMKYILSRANFGSASQRNMERLGLNVSYTRSAWTKI